MRQTYNSYLEFYRSTYSEYVVAERRSGSPQVALVDIKQPAGTFLDAPNPDIVLQMIRLRSAEGRVDLGAGWIQGPFFPQQLFVTPPNVSSNYVLDVPHEVRVLSVNYRKALERIAQPAFPADGDFGVVHERPLNDTVIANLIDRMVLEAEAGDACGALFVDSAVVAIFAALLRAAGRPPSATKGALAPWRLRRVREYVESHYESELRLSDLAQAAGDLSLFHFCRAFRRSTGLTPRRYVTIRRVERARDLLLERPDEPLAQIALACGFAAQSHFTRVFKQLVGVTPGAYRTANR